MHKSASQVRSILIQLPDDEQDTIFPSSVIHGYAANKKHVEVDDDGGRLTIQKYHKQHPLILIDGDCGESTWINIIPCCDLCTRAVNNSSSFYKCESCHFVAHKICADILPMLDFVIPLRKYADPGVELCPDPSEIIFHSIFYCIFCRRPCNGLCYYFTGANFIGLDGLPYLFIDLECMVTPSFINHASHAQHLLFRTHRLLETTTPLSCCSDYSLIYDVYRCIVCDYYIHRCGYCNQIIKGLVDEMAFSCEKCQFWLHFSCARDATATPKTTKPLRLYSEIDYERLITEMNIMFA
ncbi:hypothetical protein C2S51_022062 [Perilla frutescens var. frutescens]|nr:hypothetical protein C2S51_022062 [Perilla frutescens var. frutescens]